MVICNSLLTGFGRLSSQAIGGEGGDSQLAELCHQQIAPSGKIKKQTLHVPETDDYQRLRLNVPAVVLVVDPRSIRAYKPRPMMTLEIESAFRGIFRC